MTQTNIPTNIPKPKGEVWFLASCVEIYKDAKGLSGQAAYNHLRKTGAVDFIRRNMLAVCVSTWSEFSDSSPNGAT